MSLIHEIISEGSGQNRSLNDNEVQECEEDLELHGVYFMEHMNLVVGDRKKAEEFYCGCIGFMLDPSKVNTNQSFHINLGQQQFHLGEEAAFGEEALCPETGNVIKTNKVFGNMGLVVPCLDNVCDRLNSSNIAYKKLSVDNSICLRVSCPWGNTLYVYGLKEMKSLFSSSNNLNHLTKMNHLRYANSVGIRGVMPGIRFFEFYVDKQNAKGICEFYKVFLGCMVDLKYVKLDKNEKVCGMVMVGPNVHLAFSETDEEKR